MQYYYAGVNGYEKIRSPLLLGRLFGKHESTIRRELKRGMVTHILEEVPFERKEYNSEDAQGDSKSKYSAKGPDLKLGMTGFWQKW
jgi:IS30 family transposase